MSQTNENGIATQRRQDVLKGPPGLLFGLTLLVFILARLCFGWGPAPVTDADAVATHSPAQHIAVTETILSHR